MKMQENDIQNMNTMLDMNKQALREMDPNITDEYIDTWMYKNRKLIRDGVPEDFVHGENADVEELLFLRARYLDLKDRLIEEIAGDFVEEDIPAIVHQGIGGAPAAESVSIIGRITSWFKKKFSRREEPAPVELPRDVVSAREHVKLVAGQKIQPVIKKGWYTQEERDASLAALKEEDKKFKKYKDKKETSPVAGMTKKEVDEREALRKKDTDHALANKDVYKAIINVVTEQTGQRYDDIEDIKANALQIAEHIYAFSLVTDDGRSRVIGIESAEDIFAYAEEDYKYFKTVQNNIDALNMLKNADLYEFDFIFNSPGFTNYLEQTDKKVKAITTALNNTLTLADHASENNLVLFKSLGLGDYWYIEDRNRTLNAMDKDMTPAQIIDSAKRTIKKWDENYFKNDSRKCNSEARKNKYKEQPDPNATYVEANYYELRKLFEASNWFVREDSIRVSEEDYLDERFDSFMREIGTASTHSTAVENGGMIRVNTTHFAYEDIINLISNKSEEAVVKFLQPLLDFKLKDFAQKYPFHTMTYEERLEARKAASKEIQGLGNKYQWTLKWGGEYSAGNTELARKIGAACVEFDIAKTWEVSIGVPGVVEGTEESYYKFGQKHRMLTEETERGYTKPLEFTNIFGEESLSDSIFRTTSVSEQYLSEKLRGKGIMQTKYEDEVATKERYAKISKDYPEDDEEDKIVLDQAIEMFDYKVDIPVMLEEKTSEQIEKQLAFRESVMDIYNGASGMTYDTYIALSRIFEKIDSKALEGNKSREYEKLRKAYYENLKNNVAGDREDYMNTILDMAAKINLSSAMLDPRYIRVHAAEIFTQLRVLKDVRNLMNDEKNAIFLSQKSEQLKELVMINSNPDMVKDFDKVFRMVLLSAGVVLEDDGVSIFNRKEAGMQYMLPTMNEVTSERNGFRIAHDGKRRFEKIMYLEEYGTELVKHTVLTDEMAKFSSRLDATGVAWFKKIGESNRQIKNSYKANVGDSDIGYDNKKILNAFLKGYECIEGTTKPVNEEEKNKLYSDKKLCDLFLSKDGNKRAEAIKGMLSDVIFSKAWPTVEDVEDNGKFFDFIEKNYEDMRVLARKCSMCQFIEFNNENLLQHMNESGWYSKDNYLSLTTVFNGLISDFANIAAYRHGFSEKSGALNEKDVEQRIESKLKIDSVGVSFDEKKKNYIKFLNHKNELIEQFNLKKFFGVE